MTNHKNVPGNLHDEGNCQDCRDEDTKKEIEMNHTPTPWTIEEVDQHILGYKQWELKGPNNIIATVALHKPDAEFIVRACNAHEDLVEACKRLLKFNEDLCEDVGVSKNYPSADFARKTLAKAEGGAK